MSEKEIQREILDALIAHRKVALVWQNDHRNTRGRKYGAVGKYRPKGIPDIIGVLRGGRAFCLEVKTDKGTVTPEQEAFLCKATDAGALAAVVRNVEEALRAVASA